jgi:molybdopterin-binding protein
MNQTGYLQVRNLSVQLKDFELLDQNLEVQEGEYFVILGPTGAGKTVLLETIAGIIFPRSGTIHLDGVDITNSDPELRKVGFVYQDYALFPHLTVEENIAFGLKHTGRSNLIQRASSGKKTSKKVDIHNKVEEISSLFQITHLLDRNPVTLSGGEKQRVAMARALIINPRVLLLDEPLSSLDPEMREAIQHELRLIQHKLGATTLHITHDFEVAVALADRIGVMIDGKIIQIGTPREIFRQPDSELVARFVGVRNIFRGLHILDKDGCGYLKLDGFEFASISKLEGDVRASIRPEDILLSQQPLHSSARNNFKGKVIHISDRGSYSYVTVQLHSSKKEGKTLELVGLITQSSAEELSLKLDIDIQVAFKASTLHIF